MANQPNEVEQFHGGDFSDYETRYPYQAVGG